MTDTGWVIGPDDPHYPPTLSELESPPQRLYGLGDPGVLTDGRRISVVGARRPTPYGATVAEMAGRIAAECGITVVSGGAMGCDAAALRAALKAAGRTVVVAGTGADVVYPRSSRDVFEGAVDTGGCVISLEPWGTPPQRWAFPKRNRVIAALSRCLVVTEAGERSGTLSTADAAADLGREIYAIPGSIFSPESRGSNRLIGMGASIISSEEDLEVRISLDYGVARLTSPAVGRNGSRVLSALVANPMRPDDLAERLGEEATEMVRVLSSYEMGGLVTRLPDGRWAATRDTLLGRVGGVRV